MSFTIDPWMMRDLDLSGNELIIFALVCEAGEKGLSVSKPKLAFLSNTSVTTVRRVLSDLSERGYIERTHVGENEPSTWVACVGEQSPSSPSPIETPSGRNIRSRVMSIAK